MERKAAAIDGTNRRTDGRTPNRYIDPAPHTNKLYCSVASETEAVVTTERGSHRRLETLANCRRLNSHARRYSTV